MTENGFMDARGKPISRGIYQRGRKEEFYFFDKVIGRTVGLNPNAQVWITTDILDGGEGFVSRAESAEYVPANIRRMREVALKLRSRAENLLFQAQCERERSDRLNDYFTSELTGKVRTSSA